MKKAVKTISAVIVIIPVLFVITAFISEYTPEDIEPAEIIVSGNVEKNVENLTLLTWNIGYGGLGKDADFFMDGGVSSRPESKDVVEGNVKGIVSILKEVEADIMLLQEVDMNSSRTFKIDQAQVLKDFFSDFELAYASNFRVFFVPSSAFSPIGKVDSGLLTVSKIKSSGNQERISLPVDTSLPLRLFNLKRCMLVSRYKVFNSHNELVVINLHLSAYENEELKTEQLDHVRKYIVEEHSKGNLVIAGGDWNHILPGIERDSFGKYSTSEEFIKWAAPMPENWTPAGWHWVFNKEIPTVRNNEAPYEPGHNFVTVIDGFLVSPGVEIESVQTVQTGFEFSDHQPIILSVKL